MRLLYIGLFYLAVPAILLRLGWRSLKAPAYRRRWAERFGYYAGTAGPGAIWFHAVSVGEAEAAFPLIRLILARYPERAILVTTTTPTGSARVRAVMGDRVHHVYLPYDLPGSVARFLDHFQPSLAVIMETEIWPNLYRACRRRGIPLAVVNGRLSEKSARGYARVPSLARDCLADVALIAAQTEADAERFVRIGARADSVRVSGNMKFDQDLDPQQELEARRMREQLFGDRAVLIAGSTHEGEEAQVIEAFKAVRKQIPDLLLVLAPRHPERFAAVEAVCRAAGLSLLRRSENVPAADAAVFLLDTLGELKSFYAASDVAFVGGSLVATGGHNVLEPAAARVPVLFGPHTFNFADASAQLLAAGGALRVLDAPELAGAVLQLLQDAPRRTAVGNHARSFVERGRGALKRVADQLAVLLASSLDPKADEAR